MIPLNLSRLSIWLWVKGAGNAWMIGQTFCQFHESGSLRFIVDLQLQQLLAAWKTFTVIFVCCCAWHAALVHQMCLCLYRFWHQPMFTRHTSLTVESPVLKQFLDGLKTLCCSWMSEQRFFTLKFWRIQLLCKAEWKQNPVSL